ncbi:MAG: MBL fold metallo-hydrolase [Lautropia sp.]|nr:MBL fold metallo-hydrolase [Lautropia sp.]
MTLQHTSRFRRLALPLTLAALLGACSNLSSHSAAAPSDAGRMAATADKAADRAESLTIEAFTPGPDALFSVASVMVKGQQEVMLIDAQFSAADAQKLVDSIKASGKRLSTIFISHGDPDFYFGLATLKDAFPDARVLATAQTVEHIQKTKDGKLAYWGPQMGNNAPAYLVVPEVLQGDTLTLEGQSLKVVGLDGPAPERTVLWIPSIKTIVGGVPVVGQEHVWMADTQTPQSHADWLSMLGRIEALNPTVVIPGHFADGAPLDLRSVRFTADYIRAFDEESAKARNSAELIEAMKQRYPGLPGEESLALSAKVDKGEMQWP